MIAQFQKQVDDAINEIKNNKWFTMQTNKSLKDQELIDYREDLDNNHTVVVASPSKHYKVSMKDHNPTPVKAKKVIQSESSYPS